MQKYQELRRSRAQDAENVYKIPSCKLISRLLF